MPTPVRWKPGASRREGAESGRWVTRPHGLRARDTRSRDRQEWMEALAYGESV